jgi:hypothetical protein
MVAMKQKINWFGAVVLSLSFISYAIAGNAKPTPVITFGTPAPSIPDTSPIGTIISTVNVTMSDGSQYNENISLPNTGAGACKLILFTVPTTILVGKQLSPGAYTCTVRARKQGVTTDKSIVIRVIRTSNPSPTLSLGTPSPSIYTSKPIGSPLSTINVTMTDGSTFVGSLGFSAPYNNGSGFCSISGTVPNAVVTLGQVATVGAHNCTLMATQNNNMSAANLTVSVVDAVPSVVLVTPNPTIPDSSAIGTILSQITVSMSDSSAFSGTLAFGGTSGDGGGFCSILGSGVTLAKIPTAGTYNCSIVASQNGVSSSPANLTTIVTTSSGVTVQAINFAGGHAGTSADPFPLQAIAAAANSLPTTGGTVEVADGIWHSSSIVYINRGNVYVHGTSLNARLRFAGIASLMFQAPVTTLEGAIHNIRVSNLTIDPSMVVDSAGPMYFQNVEDSQMDHCTVLSHTNGSVAAVFWEGGGNNTINNNKFLPTNGIGGPQLQLNPLGGTRNAGYSVISNTFDSVGVLVIGIDSSSFNNNTMHNQTLANTIGIEVSPSLAGSGVAGGTGFTIDSNVFDASVGGINNAIVSEIPQDPGSVGDFRGLVISNNKLYGGVSTIALQTFEDTCIATCDPLPNTYDSKILNNQLNSYFSGSVISIRGGTHGLVDGALVQGNTLNGTDRNYILQDAHTTNATVTGNTLNPP